MFSIGLSIIILLVVAILALLTFGIPAFIAVSHGKKGKPPRKASYIAGGLLIVHWIFFLVNGYALIRPSIADAIFTPIWLGLCLAGAIAALWEFKNNKIIAVPMAGLTLISLLFSILSYGISRM